MVTGYFGLPGSGKTTFLTMIAQKELRRIRRGRSPYKFIFTNFFCAGCYQLNFNDLSSHLFEDSLILIDEITLYADSRDFKTLSKSVLEFFLLHRHYHCDIIYFTQHYNNVDKKIRDITFDLYFVRPGIFKFSVAKRIFRTLDINDETHDIVNGYRFSTIIDLIIGGKCLKLCFRPRWYRYFDSFEAPRKKVPVPLKVWCSEQASESSQV